ncbi:MAG: hypothetical protein COA63_010755 [Methylophaga sp.]|nr:hypothetical protein [Methylophaga sp.]
MRFRSILMSVVVAFAFATSFAFAEPVNDVAALSDQVAAASVGAGEGIAIAHNDDDDWGGAVPADAVAAQHQMAQQARLTASIADKDKQLLTLSDGSVLTLYSSNTECRQTTVNSPNQKVAWHPC